MSRTASLDAPRSSNSKGFPELWRLPDFPAASFFGAYLASYLERDVRQILNVGKRIVKRPKVYFHDTGFLCWLLGLAPPLPADGPWNGALWETFAFAEMRKAIAASGRNRTIYYYRDNAGVEVDFVVAGEGCRLVEVKWTETPRLSDTAGIRRLVAIGKSSQAPELDNARGFVLCRTKVDFPIADMSEIVRDVPLIEALGLGSLGRALGF